MLKMAGPENWSWRMEKGACTKDLAKKIACMVDVRTDILYYNDLTKQLLLPREIFLGFSMLLIPATFDTLSLSPSLPPSHLSL